MDTLGIILVVISFAYGVILCRAAARTPRCRTCQIPTESISVIHDGHRLPVIETAYWCPRCARVVSRRFLAPDWE
jgi:hypothetical protein